MRKFCLLLILSLALPVFCLLQAVEPPKKEIRAVWLTTVYGLDWPHKPATTEAGRKAQQQALLDILDRLQEANFNMVFIQARLRGDVIYRSAIEPATKTFSGKYGVLPGYDPLAFFRSQRESHEPRMAFHSPLMAFINDKSERIISR